jgi:hypothetical protein
MRSPSRLLALLALLLIVLLARPTHAQAWFDAKQTRLEDAYADGDIDEEDLARIPAMRRRSTGSDVLAQTWVSLVGFSRELPSGVTDVGGFVVVGLALDKIAQGRERADVRPRFADGPAPDGAPHPSPPPPAPPPLTVDAALARGSVRAAWRASGIQIDDSRIDAMIARSRLSAVLPETRIRVMQVFQDGEHTTSYVDEAGTVVDTVGTTTTVEARLTWRFDRLLFADDEPSLERLRMEREEARTRIAAKVLELLFVWQRASLEEAGSDAGSRAESEAALRRLQAELSLDVLTGGWFGERLDRASRGRHK